MSHEVWSGLVALLVAAVVWLSLRLHASSQEPAHDAPARPPIEVLSPGTGPAGDDEPQVDIVAVHGLGANVDWSWTWRHGASEQPPVHWLRDHHMLPRVLPRARILVYSYESKWHANAPDNRLQQCGQDLVQSLRACCSDTKRPIVFVGHSLGGLVILYALSFAREKHVSRYLAQNTAGFVALGTPFRGTQMQFLAKALAWLLTPFHSDTGIIQDLGYDSPALKDKIASLYDREDGLSVPTRCFFERDSTDYGRRYGLPGLVKGKVVSEASACIVGDGGIRLPSDHLKMNKFYGPDDPSFVSVSGALLELCAKSKETLQRRNARRQRARFVMDFGRNSDFIQRESLLQRVIERVLPGRESDNCQITVIEGFGGMGKTQLAIETAYRVRDEDSECSVFWVPATNAAAFENAYARIGKELGLQALEGSRGNLKAIVKAELSKESIGKWLLIVDNADDAQLLFGDGQEPGLSYYFPFSRQGSILITTRIHEVVPQLDVRPQDTISVSMMSKTEAFQLLSAGVSERQLRNREKADELLDFLDCLPLAIKQASAYLARSQMSIADYVRNCHARNSTLVKSLRESYTVRGRYAGISNAVFTTWHISFEHLQRDKPLAAELFRYMCFLSEKAIPFSLLVWPSGHFYSTTRLEAPELHAENGENPGSGAGGGLDFGRSHDADEVREALMFLKSYAFVTERDESGLFDIHRLVRLAMRIWIEDDGLWSHWAATGIQRIEGSFPDPEHHNRADWVSYLPHTESALACCREGNRFTAVSLLFKIGTAYHYHGQYRVSGSVNRTLYELCEEEFGSSHANTLSAMSNVAMSKIELGEYEAAAAIDRQTLARRTELLGPKDPDTLTSLMNLTYSLSLGGKYDEAEPMGRKALALHTEVCGPADPSTLHDMNNLAMILSRQGRHGEAEAMHRDALRLRRQTLGSDHPDTLESMDNLADVLGCQGRLDEAEELASDSVRTREGVQGRAHPQTVLSMENFAKILAKQGKDDQAAGLRERIRDLAHD